MGKQKNQRVDRCARVYMCVYVAGGQFRKSFPVLTRIDEKLFLRRPTQIEIRKSCVWQDVAAEFCIYFEIGGSKIACVFAFLPT